MRPNLVAGLLVSVLGFATATASVDDVADVEEAVRATLVAHNAGDAEAFNAQFVAGASGFFGDGSLLEQHDPEDLSAAFEAGAHSELEITDLKVEVHGSTAVVTCYFRGAWIAPNGNRTEGSWRYSAVRVKGDGAWRVLNYHFSQSDVHAAQEVVARYHKSFEDRDAAAAAACRAETYLALGKSPGEPGDPTRWSGGAYVPSSRVGLEALSAGMAMGGRSYQNQIEFLHTSLNGQTAVVVVNETGSSTLGDQENSWENARNIWYLTKEDGEWKIAASLHNLK